MAAIKPKGGNIAFANDPWAHLGGYQDTVYVGLFEDTKTFPAVPPITAATTHEAAVTAIGTLTPKTGQQFFALQCKVHRLGQEGNFSAEDNSAAEYVLTFTMQESAEVEGMLVKFKGANLFAAVQQADGQFRIYGQLGYPARITGAVAKHPEDPKDAKGPEIEIKITAMPFPPAYWTGTISTALGV